MKYVDYSFDMLYILYWYAMNDTKIYNILFLGLKKQQKHIVKWMMIYSCF